MSRRESPVDVGQKVYVVDYNNFEILEGTVTSNPSDHLWVTFETKRKVTPTAQFIGTRYATTYTEAVEKAVKMIEERKRALKSEIEALDAQKRFLQK